MATSLTRPIANRAVHLRITPRPSNISESREMMRLLSQFGEIELFKSFKYERLPGPNSAVIIFKEEQAAEHCLRMDPIRFRMERARAPGNAISGTGAEAGEAEEVETTMFQIRVNEARMHFRDQINASRFHGAFLLDTKSAAQQDLAKRVPIVGLSDVAWKAEGRPWRIIHKEQEAERQGGRRRKSLQEVYEEGRDKDTMVGMGA